MLYEVRTYTLRPGTVAEFEERFAKRLPLREKHSKLGPSGTPSSVRSIRCAYWLRKFDPDGCMIVPRNSHACDPT
jgi:hypothetical protein